MNEIEVNEHLAGMVVKMVKDGEIPRYLYRYMSLAHIEDIIKNNRLWFSRPNTLNDPFDCRIFINKDFTYEEILAHLLKYNSRNRSRDLIEEKAKEVFAEPRKFTDIINGSFNTTINETKVCCFSQIYNSILMWSHYTNGHKGLVIKFDVLADPALFSVPININYTEKYPSIDIMDLGNSSLGVLKTKFSAWAYEKEIRILKFSQSSEEGIHYHFNKSTLIEIIFGDRTPKHEIEKIMQLSINRGYEHLDFKIIGLDDSEYKLILKNAVNPVPMP